MPDASLPPPFDAYVGDEPYIFVSYAHKDAAAVYPEITQLHEQGFRIWYDEGIDPGNEWPEEIGAALIKASYFIVFISPNAGRSENVRNEIHLALDEQIPFLAVHLQETDLPVGLKLRIGSRQALLLWRTERDRFNRKMERALPADLRRKASRIKEQPISTAPSAVPGLAAVSAKAVIQPDRFATKVSPIAKPDASAASKRYSKKGGVEVVLIPAGEFLMGDDDQSDNKRHTVYLDACMIGKTPVTVGQFKAYCADCGIDFSKFMRPSWGWIDDHPMVNVNWQEARDFCKWAGGELPTEAQWEKAARGTNGLKYPWGNDWDGSRLQWSSDGNAGGAKSTAPVTAHPSGASPYGCLDMAGNVWQWCSDWYAPIADGRADRNPTGPSSGSSRVLRGGSWFNYYPDRFCSAIRGSSDPAAQGGAAASGFALPVLRNPFLFSPFSLF